MSTYLLAWNPRRFQWTNLSDIARRTRDGELVRENWSCGSTRRITTGDRLFMVRVGKEPKGIMASGYCVSDPYEGAHWGDELDKAFYVDVDFERVLDSDTEAILGLQRLESGQLAQVEWTPQQSGTNIPDELCAELETLWANHLAEMGAPSQRNPPWQRDELILALDLYFRHRPTSISKTHPAVVALSEALNALPIHTSRPDAVRFRNPNGVYMKLCNFLRFDPEYEGTGLSRGGSLEKEIWEQFAGRRDELQRLAEAITATTRIAEIQEVVDEEEDEFPEGQLLFRLHRVRERNRDLVKRAKERALRQHGRLACVVCEFDFEATYGPRGAGFIECHHTKPLSELSSEAPVRIKDVALVCSNCHRMIHRWRPWLTIDELSTIRLR